MKQSNIIVSFRTTGDNTVLTSSYIPASATISDVIAKQNIITSGSVNLGDDKTLTLRAGNSITLSSGFHAQAGSTFNAEIKEFDCTPIEVEAWTSVACIGSGLKFNVANATNYSVRIYSISGSLIYSGSGSITGNPVIVWSALGAPIGYYTAVINFFSPHSKISNSYNILVQSCANNVPIMPSLSEELLATQEITSNKFDFILSPNPNDGNFILQLATENSEPYSIYIFNSFGILVSKIEHCNGRQIQINHSGLIRGIYYIKLTMGIDSVIKKIIIQ
ncbi:MAG: hypothetical protein BGO29_05170 [Bacteroidales bacterium 36-12]|nr:MAG: hypothetical protein BGO29_05170 [Bacteroidales bacterium 36-12]